MGAERSLRAQRKAPAEAAATTGITAPMGLEITYLDDNYGVMTIGFRRTEGPDLRNSVAKLMSAESSEAR
jgi:hypothetical protein